MFLAIYVAKWHLALHFARQLTTLDSCCSFVLVVPERGTQVPYLRDCLSGPEGTLM